MRTSQRIFCAALAASMISACGTQRPVVYPQANNAATDRARANAAVETCITMAKESGIYGSGNGNLGRRTAENAAVGGAAGGAAGAAAGAVYGGNAGKAAAAGAAGGAAGSVAGGLVRGLFRGTNRGPDVPTRRYVERCLTDRGYKVAGWR